MAEPDPTGTVPRAVPKPTSDARSAEPPSTARAPWFGRAALLGVLSVLAATLLAFTARWFWPGELMVSLAWQLGFASFAVACACLVTARPRLALLACLAGGVHTWPEARLYLPQDRPPLAANEVELRLATCNLLWGNADHASFPVWLAEHAPDVVVLQEISLERRSTLEALPGYPHVFFSPPVERWNAKTWGTAILSRLPFESTREIPTAVGRPPIEAVIRVGSRSVTVRGTHPSRPGRGWRIEQRNEVLGALADAAWNGPCVLAGDLNVTSTSPVFHDLVERAGLRDSRAGFGRQPSFVLKRLASLAIDHVLLGGGVRCLERRTTPLAGSDHRAVLVRLAVPLADSGDDPP